MPNIKLKSLSLMVQKLWPRLKSFATESQTDRTKTRCPPIPFTGHKNCIHLSNFLHYATIGFNEGRGNNLFLLYLKVLVVQI